MWLIPTVIAVWYWYSTVLDLDPFRDPHDFDFLDPDMKPNSQMDPDGGIVFIVIVNHR